MKPKKHILIVLNSKYGEWEIGHLSATFQTIRSGLSAKTVEEAKEKAFSLYGKEIELTVSPPTTTSHDT